MAKNKKAKTRPRRTPLELIIEQKAKKFVEAEKAFWKSRYEIEKRHREVANQFELAVENTISDNLSSIVWGLQDGVAFVRYQANEPQTKVEFRALPMTLEKWGNEGLIVPSSKGDISLAQSGVARGIGTLSFVHCQINDASIPYAEITHARYNQGDLAPAIERAIVDFQISLLGLQLQTSKNKDIDLQLTKDHKQTIEMLETLSQKFNILLGESAKEEELQVFLKEYPFILNPMAEVIPKKKLGEDFITDFVLILHSDQGATFVLVELEKASHPILTQDFALSSQTSHAIKQTRDWDVWLEKNKAYLQTKLSGFESPRYLIIIGRSTSLDEAAKAYLRSYNRDWKNIELLTYDDVLVRFNSTIKSLKSTIGMT